jgi:outer membrane protein assembly factor BamB
MGDGSVRALDAGTGAQLWRKGGFDVLGSGLAAFGGDGGRVVFADGSAVVELKAGTGKRTWSTPTGGTVGGIGLYSVPAVQHAKAGEMSPDMKLSLRSIIVVDQAGDVYSLDPKTGVVDWGEQKPGPINSPPAIANGVVYFTEGPPPPGGPPSLVAVNAETGAGLEQADDLNPQPFPPGPPSIGDGHVFVGNFGGGIGEFELGP